MLTFSLARTLALTTALFVGLASAGGAALDAAKSLQPPLASNPVLSVTAGSDAQGRPVMAWIELTPKRQEQVHVARLDNSAASSWTMLGQIVNEDPNHNASQLSLYAYPLGRPAAASTPPDSIWLGWSEGSGEAHIDSYLLSQWTNGKWSSPSAAALRRNLSDAGRSRAFSLDQQGQPLIAWTDIGTGPRKYPSVVLLKTWQPSSKTLWQDTPPMNIDLSAASFMPSVVAQKGVVSVAYVEGPVTQSNVQVRRWNGRAWSSLGATLNITPLDYVFGPVLRSDSQGRAVVAWLEDHNGVDTVYVSRWNGSAWQRLGGPVSAAGQFASHLSLALDAQDHPVLAWTSGPDGSRIPRAAVWHDGATDSAGHWQVLPVQPPLSAADTDSTSITATKAGLLLVWREQSAGRWHLRTQLFSIR